MYMMKSSTGAAGIRTLHTFHSDELYSDAIAKSKLAAKVSDENIIAHCTLFLQKPVAQTDLGGCWWKFSFNRETHPRMK